MAQLSVAQAPWSPTCLDRMVELMEHVWPLTHLLLVCCYIGVGVLFFSVKNSTVAIAGCLVAGIADGPPTFLWSWHGWLVVFGSWSWLAGGFGGLLFAIQLAT